MPERHLCCWLTRQDAGSERAEPPDDVAAVVGTCVVVVREGVWEQLTELAASCSSPLQVAGCQVQPHVTGCMRCSSVPQALWVLAQCIVWQQELLGFASHALCMGIHSSSRTCCVESFQLRLGSRSSQKAQLAARIKSGCRGRRVR